MIAVAAKVIAKKGKEAEVKKLLIALVANTVKEDGCLSYRFHESADDSCEFVSYENWRDKASESKHLASPHLAELLARASELFARPPEIKYYREIA